MNIDNDFFIFAPPIKNTLLNKTDQYIIPFGDLDAGTYQFEFPIDADFFNLVETNLYDNANVKVKVTMHKTASTLTFDMQAKGSMFTECNRCLSQGRLNIDGKTEKFFIARIGGENTNISDEIVVLPPNELRINIATQLFDFFHSLVPLNYIACEAENNVDLCDIEVLNKLEKHQQKEEKHDLRWETLLNIKNKLKNN